MLGEIGGNGVRRRVVGRDDAKLRVQPGEPRAEPVRQQRLEPAGEQRARRDVDERQLAAAGAGKETTDREDGLRLLGRLHRHRDPQRAGVSRCPGGEPVSAVADDEDGDRAAHERSFGDAAEDPAQRCAPAVRADDQQPGAESQSGRRDGLFGRVAAHQLDLDEHSARANLGRRPLELAPRVDEARVVCRLVRIGLERVNERDGGVESQRQRDGRLAGALGLVGEVRRDSDSHV